MKNGIKYAIVGVAGYLIGFYEMKYKVIKLIAKNAVEKQTEEKVEEEEAQ